LAQRLAAVSRSIVSVDSDPASVWRASERLQSKPSMRTSGPSTSARSWPAFVTCRCAKSLQKGARNARPGGELALVGISANKTIADWTWAGLRTPAAHVGSWLHRETRNIGVLVAEPGESLGDPAMPLRPDIACSGETVNRCLLCSTPRGRARVGGPWTRADSRRYRMSSRRATPRCCSSIGRKRSWSTHGCGIA